MKKIYKGNDCNAEGMGKPWEWSRITMACPLLTLLFMLVLGGWNSEAWGQLEYNHTMTQNDYNNANVVITKVAEGNRYEWADGGVRLGYFTKWYPIAGTTQAPGSTGNKYIVIALSSAGIPDKLSFNFRCITVTTVTGASWKVEESSNNSNWTEKWSSTSKSTNSQSSGNIQLSKGAKYIRLTYSGNYAGLFSNIKVTELKYLNNPTETDLDCGTADINSESTSGQVNVAWCNVPAMSYEITDDAEGLFSVSVDVNSEAGKYNTSHFTVTYKHTKAGTHTAKLKITDTYNSYSKTVNLSGTTNKQQPTITWSSNESFFNVDDVLSATSAPGTTVTLSSTGNESYVGCEGNSATMLAATSGKITITAHVTGTAIYADKDFTKEIRITNLEKQHINWDQEFTRLKTTDGTKTITLNATSTSGLPVTYELVGDKTGLSLTQSGSVWTLTYSASECKNTTIVAKQGGNSTYAPASSVSKTVKVIDPTKVCDTNETLVNSTVTLKSQSTTYNIDIPSTMTIQVSRTKTGFIDIYLNGFKVEIYSGRNGTGDKLHEYSYKASDINNSKTISLSNLNIAAKSVKLISDASNGYNVTSVTYTKQKKCTISPASLSFETYPNTETSAKTFDVTYVNYPISLECSNPKFTFSPAEFGDCDAYGTQTVSVTYTAGPDEGDDSGVIYIKDNTGAILQTCSLTVVISKVGQSITSTNIQSSYNTTDRIELSAEANSGLTAFEYSASPAGVASFAGNVMTFSQSGTIAITATQPGSNVYASASTTVEGVKVNKVTPTIATKPTVAEIKYKGSFANNQLTEGLATVTLRGVENTPVAGTFTWKNAGQVTDGQGSHEYSITFVPTDEGMYNSKTFTQSVTISRADGGIEMNNGEVKVKIAGINDDLNECKIDLDDLVEDKIVDAVANRAGTISYEVISENKAFAAIDGENKFSATKVGTYTIRATQAQTNYYEQATDEFTVTVNKLVPEIVFDNQNNPEYIYSGDVIKKPAYRKYNGKEIDRNVQYVSSDPSITGAIYVDGTTLTARNVTAPEGSAVEVTITASASADALYAATTESVEHNYAVRAKRSPVFTMDTYVNENGSKTLNIGEQAIITYNENTNEFLTVGTASEHAYVTFSHDKVNRTITVTAVKGTITGDGVQQIIVNQPGNDYLFPREITYTFTVKRNVSALSLDPLTTAMEVEDTVTSIYSGLTNTTDGLQFSCSPAGSMKYEDGKLIALQAGTSTVTFSQPATEFWTGISKSKTITVSKKNPNVTTALANRHPWYSIIEHPFSSLNTEKALTITSSNESLAKYIKEEDKIYVYGTSGNVTFTVNQDANYKYNAVENYKKTFEIFQPNNRLPFTLTESNLSDYKGGGKGNIKWDGGGVIVYGDPEYLSGYRDWSAKYIILKFVGVPDKLSFDFENTSSVATQYGWHFYESSNGSDWTLIKEYQDLLMDASGGTSSGSESNLHLDPATQYIKLEYHGNFGGRFKNVSITERKEIAPKANSMDFGLGYNGNDPTTRTIKVDWYNVKQCTVTITGADADKFVLGEGSNTIYSTLDNYGTAELSVSYKHETNSETTHTATLHIEDADHNYAEITLNGQTTPAPQDIIWRNDLTPMPINGVFPSAAVVASNQPITLSSDNEGIVRVVNDTLIGVAAGTARVTATAEGNTKWAETTSYIDIEVTTKNVQFITWNDNLSNRKREEGQTVEITLTATSTAGLPITYELDEDAQLFASISGNVLRLTGWGSGQVIAHQVGNEDYVAVQAVKSLVSRNPSAGCRPLVGEYKSEYTIWTLGEKEIELDGREPATIEFDAKCDASALWGLHVGEYYDGFYHEVAEISRLGDNNLTSSYKHFGPFELNRKTTKVRIYTTTGATMNRTFKNVEVTLAKYLELADNQLHFEQVDKGSTKTQSFYINYSNLSGVLDVEMENKENTQFTVVTTTVGEDCGDIAQSVRIDISCTGSTLGTENNTIIVHNADQSLSIPVSATVVLPSQTITWEPETDIFTTDHVVLSATATSELPVSFTSGNTDIAEVVYEAGVYSLDIKKYGDVEITAHQAGNENWSAATDKTLTFYISRVTPEVTTWPTAQVILPNTVGGATLNGGVAPEGIAGSFQWEDESQTVTREAHTFNVVFVPNNTNYYETVSHALEIEILKTPQTITWNRANVSEEGCSNVVILDATASSGLPITYHSSDSTKAYAIDAVVSEVAVKKLYILKGGDVTITAVQPGDDTYAAAPSVSKTITLNRVVPTIEELPTATYMYVHHFLSNSTPQGGVVKAGVNTVDGVFNWENGSEVMDDPGTNQRTVVFHPYNSDFYQEVSAVIDVEVRRFAPTVLHDFTTETKVYGTTLSEFVLNGSGHGYDYTDPAHYEIDGTFAWKDGAYIPSVSETTAVLVFHPEHSEWYDDVEVEVPIVISQATLLGATATATIFYGQVLSEAVLVNTTQGIVNNTTGVVAGTVTWDPSLDGMHYYEVGEYNLPIRFTSTDGNYDATDIAGTAVLKVNSGYVFDGNNGASTTWGDDANWQGHVAPEDNERVVILADVDVTTDVEVESMTIKEGVTVVVKDGATLTIGSSDSYVRDIYGNLYVETGGKVILNGGELKVKDFVLEAELGDNTTSHATSGQVSGDEKLNVRGDAYFRISFDPRGQIDYGWYDFTVPFEVEVVNGVYDKDGNKLTNNVDYAVMEFSEERRATNSGRPWIWFSGTLQPGRLYTITLDDEKNWNTFLFKKKVGSNVTGSNSFSAAYSNSGETTDRGWNGLGNGTLQHRQLNNLPAQTKIQVNDHVNERYVELEANDYTYAVGTAFFVQVDEETDIDLTSVSETRGFLAPTSERRTVDEFRLALTAEDATYVADRLWVSASEEATGEYVIGRDLLKMGTPTSAKVAQMWTVSNGQNLCDLEMPLVGNNASASLNLYAPQAGTYEIAVERAPEDATLYLTRNGRVVWNLSMSPCELDLDKGTTESYGLRIVADRQTTTDVEQVESEESKVESRKVLIDDKIYIITPEGKMYDIVGKGVNY